MDRLLVQEARTLARLIGKQVLPPRYTERLRTRVQKARRDTRRRTIEAAAATRASLAADLARLGVTPGRDMLVHAAMSALGPVEGGAATMLAALADAAGPEATLLAPAYPMSGTMIDWLSDSAPFDVSASPSRMGALSELLRKSPGAKRSAHPTHSVAALGPHAEAYTGAHHAGATATGAHSPFWKHMEREGLILCLGSGIGKVTSYHVVEDVAPGFPVDPYLPAPMAKTVVMPDGRRIDVATRVNDPRLSPWRVDNFAPKEVEILGLLRRDGLVREGRVGAAHCHLIDAAGLFRAMQAWAAAGITIYHAPALLAPWRWLAGRA